MAIRQYIGARYVPKFMGVYDVTQQYEALSVVDNGLGTSYIAKIPVPVGTPLTNTTYWALYGASSGSIINLQNQIDQINNVDLPGINGDIANINNVEIPALQASIASATANASAIGEFVRQYANKKILIVGDSLSMPGSTWADDFKLMAEAHGCTVKNIAVGGWTTGQCLTAVQAETTPYDLVIVWAGINDCYHENAIGPVGTSGTFLYNMKAIFDHLLTLNDMCRIFAFGFSWYKYIFDTTKSEIFYNIALYQLCKMSGVAFKDMSGIVCNSYYHHASTVPGDLTGIHFTSLAQHTLVYDIILNKIIIPASEKFDQTIQIDNQLFTPASGVTIYGNIAGVYEAGKFITFSGEIRITSAIAANSTILTVANVLKPYAPAFMEIFEAQNTSFTAGKVIRAAIGVNGEVIAQDALDIVTGYRFTTVYMPAISFNPSLAPVT